MDNDIKRVLIIVPHPDDELNVAGSLIIYLKEKHCEIYVAYTTNGDFNKRICNKRLIEAINALSVLGIDEDHIIFLGYANEWLDDNHIYNFKTDGKVLVSKSGRACTSALPDHCEFAMQKYGKHNAFLRCNFKKDLKNMILEHKADYLICNDFDSHPDHRATSLMFEEVMGEILKEDCTYKPIILKKFAYSGVWKGSKDYYHIPMVATVNTIHGNIHGFEFETESPYIKWKERIQIAAPMITQTHLLRKNILFRAAKKHKSQIAWYQMLRIANSDMVYWWRPSTNLLLNAIVSTSSGECKFLNDFKMYEASDVRLGMDNINNNNYLWIPSLNDNKPFVDVHFNKLTNIKMIRIFSDYDMNNYIEQISIISDGGKKYIVDNNHNESPIWNIYLDINYTENIKIIFLKWKGYLAVSELEIYDHILDFYNDSDIRFDKYEDKGCVITGPSFSQRIEMIWLNICLLFKYKILHEIKLLLKK